MNSATKFLVMILFIGVVCADVDARKLQKVSKELMGQKPLSLSTMPLPVLTTELGEAVSATKGGGVEIGVGDLVSKDTKLGISIPNTAVTNGIGTELAITVTSRATYRKSANDRAAEGPGGPSSVAAGNTVVSTNGTVTVEGPNPSAYSNSTATREAGADADAGPDGATGRGSASGSASTRASGSTDSGSP